MNVGGRRHGSMKCPYCGRKMILGKVQGIGGPSIVFWWECDLEDYHIKGEPRIVEGWNDEKRRAWSCSHCNKLVIDS